MGEFIDLRAGCSGVDLGWGSVRKQNNNGRKSRRFGASKFSRFSSSCHNNAKCSNGRFRSLLCIVSPLRSLAPTPLTPSQLPRLVRLPRASPPSPN